MCCCKKRKYAGGKPCCILSFAVKQCCCGSDAFRKIARFNGPIPGLIADYRRTQRIHVHEHTDDCWQIVVVTDCPNNEQLGQPE